MIDRERRRPVPVTNADWNEVPCGFENKGSQTVVFENAHPRAAHQPLAWHRIECAPGKWVMLPHKKFIGHGDCTRCILIAEGSLLTIYDRHKDKCAFYDDNVIAALRRSKLRSL